MTALATVRSEGVTVRLAEGGGLGVKGATAELKTFIGARKAEIIAALRREAIGGAVYDESLLCYWVDEMYFRAKRIKRAGVSIEQCTRLMELLVEIHNGGLESLDGAKALVATHKVEALALSGQIAARCSGVLEGPQLEGAFRRVFEGAVAGPLLMADPEPVAAPARPKVNVGAFMGAPVDHGALTL